MALVDPIELIRKLFAGDGWDEYDQALEEIKADWMQRPQVWLRPFEKGLENARTLLADAEKRSAEAWDELDELKGSQDQQAINAVKAKWFDAFWDGVRAEKLAQDMQRGLHDTEQALTQAPAPYVM